MSEEEDKPEACEHCYYMMENLHRVRYGPVDLWLCGLCLRSGAGRLRALLRTKDPEDVLRVVSFLGNVLLAEFDRVLRRLDR